MYKALISFSGLVSMRKGEVGEIADKAVAEDLLKVRYIEEISPAPAEEAPKATKTRNKKTPKGG